MPISRICKQNSNILLFFSFASNIYSSTKRKVGFYRNIGNDGTFNQDVTQLQAIHAREIFPCFDQPDMKGIQINLINIVLLRLTK